MSKKILRSLFILCMIITPMISEAQNFSGYNWNFGTGTSGIRFSRSSNAVSLVTQHAVSSGGSAVVSDPVNGNLLFYTDGVSVYDLTNTVMPNGTGLNGNPAGNQSVVVAGVPGQSNQYYIITTSAAGNVSFSIVDMTQFGNAAFPKPPYGDVLNPKNTPIPALTNQSDAMLTIANPNGTDFWLITHTKGAATYSVTPFTSTGPGTTTSFSGGLIQQVANFSYHPASKRLAVSPAESTRDIEILNFDPATGNLTFNQTILNSGVSNAQAIFDTEWSGDGKYLYISRTGAPGVQADLLQADLSSSQTSLTSVLPQPNTIARSFGLQMAPDSSIYYLYQATSGGPFLMGRITRPDSVANLVNYVPQVFTGRDFKGQQFPSFTPARNQTINLSFVADGLCANAPTTFFPTVSPGADSLVWDFGDGSTANQWSPVHTYQNGGAFNVSVTAYLNGQTQASTQPLNITNFDTQINLVQDTTACSCQLPYSKKTNPPSPPPACALPKFTVTARVQGSGTPQLQWYGPSGLLAGQTTATLTPDSAGYYYLVATVGGCSTYAGVNIKEYGIQDQRANIWYFGNDAGIDFNPLPDDPAKPISNPVMNAPEGTSTISDRNGQVIFFTDGETVWNRQFQVVDTGIGGDQDASQSALIMPVQGDETLYYIFTTQSNPEGGYDLRYSLFDLKLNGGLGGLVQKNVLLFSKSTERITGNANWLIAHEAGNNSFRAYKVTADGIGAPVISSIGSDHQINVDQNGEGYMKLGSKNMLAVALSTPGVSNKIEVFDFADSTGKITNFRTADLKNANGQVYGVEFSPGSNKLYATLQGSSSSQIYEFAFDSLSRPYLKKPPIAPVNEKLGAIQTGPDGQVYVAVDGKQFLGTIQVNEDTTKVSNFTLNGFGLLSGTNSRLGLPNFIQTISDPQQGPGIAASGFCLGDSTSFSGTGTDQIDQFQWFFGDGQGSTLQSVKHVYAAAGTYLVSLRITNRCGLDTTLTQSVTIVPPPAPPTFLQAGQNPVLCNGPLTLEATPATNPDLANLHFAWSTGDTTRTIVVTQQNIYSVTITNKQGCTSNGSLPIADNRPVVELGPNQTICQNISLPPLDAQNPGSNYSWTINGVVVGNSRTQSVDTSVPSPPTYEYEVTVTDPTFGCVAKDSVIYTINPAPVFNVSNITNSNCGAATGSFQLNITGPTGTLFSYFITGPSPTPSGVNQSIGSITPLNLAAGTYGITVTDQVSGCPTTSTASINDNTFTVNGTQNGTCDPININVSVSAGAITPIKYRVIDKRTLQVVQPTTPNIMSLNFSTNNLSSNNQHYVVEVTDNGGCVASDDDVLLNHNPKVAATLSSNVCSTPITVTATGGTGWTWTGPNITSAANIASISAAPPAGSQTYNVTITDGVNCPLDTAITVDVQTPSTVALAQTDACADQVTVSANVSPSGSYLYRWSRNGGAPDPSLGGPQVIATKANDGQIYTVSIYNTINGCNTPSNPLTVQVDGTLSVTLATTTACEGLPFTLTATPSRSVSTYAWALGNAPISGQTTNTLTVQDGKAGTYSVTATEASCKATASINIIVAPVTEGNLSSRIRICPDPAAPKEVQEAVLNPGTFQTYNWFKNGVSLGITTPTLTVSEGGKYTVDLVNNFGCPSKDQSEVVEECDPVITGPNAFRPSSTLNQNGDYVNQTFRLFTFFIDDENFSIFIFNRWGEMVYKSEDRQFRWNGGYNNNSGQLLPAGTYSYVVRYKSSYRPELGIQEKRGGVVLLR